jgi:hypothetical protein
MQRESSVFVSVSPANSKRIWEKEENCVGPFYMFIGYAIMFPF